MPEEEPTNKKIGDQTYVFGEPGSAPFMQVESISIEDSPEFEAEAQNDIGNVVTVVKGPVKQTITASGYLAGGMLPARGDTVTVGGIADCVFDKISITRSNKDFCKAEISAIKYNSATIL